MFDKEKRSGILLQMRLGGVAEQEIKDHIFLEAKS